MLPFPSPVPSSPPRALVGSMMMDDAGNVHEGRGCVPGRTFLKGKAFLDTSHAKSRRRVCSLRVTWVVRSGPCGCSLLVHMQEMQEVGSVQESCGAPVMTREHPQRRSPQRVVPSAIDQVEMTPLELYRKYKVFPWSMVFHLLLLVVVSTFAVCQTQLAVVRRREGREMWASLFFRHVDRRTTRHSEALERWGTTKYFMTTRGSLLRDPHFMFQSYVQLDRATVDNWFVFSGLHNASTDMLHAPILEVTSRVPDTASGPFYDPSRSRMETKLYKLEHNRLPGMLGKYREDKNGTMVLPKGYEQWVSNVVSIKFLLEIATLVPRHKFIMGTPHRIWRVTVSYDCSIPGNIIASLDASNFCRCDMATGCSFFTYGTLLLSMVFLTAVCFQFCIIVDSYRSMKIYLAMKRLEPNTVTEKLTWSDVFDLYKFSPVISTIGNVSLMTFSGLLGMSAFTRGIYAPDDDFQQLFLACGLGCLWASSTNYVRTEEKYNTIFVTLKYASIEVGRLMVGVVPVFIGYAIFGYSYYGRRVPRFGDFGHSMMELFAIVNGDEIHPTFLDLQEWNVDGTIGLMEYAYVYTAIIVVSYFAMNLCIAMIEAIYHDFKLAKGEFNISPELRRLVLRVDECGCIELS